MKLKKFILPVMISVLLAGCSDAAAPDPSPDSPDTETTVLTEAESDAAETEADISGYITGESIPLLSIETVSRDPDVMDFVNKPVNSYVARSVASWTPGYRMPPAPYYEPCTVTVTDTDGTVLLSASDAEVKVRGNWTTNYIKKPLRIKFAEKQSLIGLNDGAQMKNWVLLAEYKDKSMLRNKTALSVARELLGADGLYAADAAFVEVEINHEYWGVYLLTEQQQVNPNRIDITEPEKDHTGTDIGYFMEFDGYFFNEDELQQFTVDYADNALLVPFDGKGGSGRRAAALNEGFGDKKKDVGITIKSDINSQEQHDFIESYMNNVYRIMYYAAYNDEAYCFDPDYSEIHKADITPREAVEQVINMDSLADMYIISELTCDADIYWSSFFMSVDFGEGGDKKLRFEAPWDFDSALGNKDRCADGKGFYAANIVWDVNHEYQAINPWLAVLMYEDWYNDLIADKWTALYDSGAFERAYAMIESDTELFRDAFDRNYERWDNIRYNEAWSEWSRESAACKTHKESAEHLEEWLRTRVEFLNEHLHK